MTDMSQRIQMEGNTFFQIGVETLPEEGKSYVIQKSDKAKAAVKLVEGSGGGEPGPQGPQGPAGPAGAAATVTVGDVTTLDAGQDATVTNAGTTSAAVFNFGIPKGPKGTKVTLVLKDLLEKVFLLVVLPVKSLQKLMLQIIIHSGLLLLPHQQPIN